MSNAAVPEFFLDQLRAIVGPQGFYEAAADIEPYLTDHRKLFRGTTPLVLRPASTDEVSRILKLCNEHKVGVVPVGGNTGYCGGTAPSEDGSQIVVSLARLKKVRNVDPLNNTMTVEAGCVLADVQQAAANVDRLFPLSLGSEGSCQIGGNLSTNAGGTAVVRYGMTRDLVLGLEAVLADGRVMHDLNGLRKNNTGYDVRDLFIGAEGTLGIITAATLKLFPLPRTFVTALVALRDPQAAVDLLSYIRTASSDGLTTFELMPRNAVELVFKHIPNTNDPFDRSHPWYILLEATSSHVDSPIADNIATALASAQESNLILDAVVASSETQREMLWRIRETIPEAQRLDGGSIKHDISVAISDLPRFIEEGMRVCNDIAPEGRIIVYGHLGDGSLHFNINTPAQADESARKTFLQKASVIHRAMHDLTAQYHGSISAEHGIGRLKRDELARYKDPVAMQLMRDIKRAFDPNGIMNPGKVLSI
ncbi:MAG TPA: FAD-binding oxidoreductase [Steroidobacteraceae bacterium]|nr:FAD-binding oxidoreductase [Steroidobacteraceae bacterium]